ncbi:hypothetical protein JZM24_02780 [Candidatus Sodalis endolongispinus]|uniref:Uncharacterized protein n=1 Tax=Candidatus Sodalis endolongispinus TaxID=2812662 RepID=A0ABS5Y8T7_9GAMM|nr:hypothetical protein [Candidatus Sodalis endolongispinus]MBT9431347.1 hypothetical protein [Candidatus Sodalis endolongispinus]
MKDIIAPIDSEDGLFHDGDPTGDVRGTVLYAQWLNAMQGAVIDTQTEHKNILAAAGMQPNPAQNSQLAEAIKGLIQQSQEENSSQSLLKRNNGADIPDKAAFVAHLGLKETVEQATRWINVPVARLTAVCRSPIRSMSATAIQG